MMMDDDGLWQWMAPEAMEDNRIDYKCDVYSYGIVMWELAYQAIPWAEWVPIPFHKRAPPMLIAKGHRQV